MPDHNDSDLQTLEQRYDSGLAMRPTSRWLAIAVFVFSVLFAGYHYITAYLGVPVDYWHMGIHLSGVLLLVFIGFPMVRRARDKTTHYPNRWWRYANVPLYDWIFAAIGIFASLYIGFTWRGADLTLFGWHIQLTEQALRQGNPATLDIVVGSCLVFLVLEAARRTIGWVLPCIVLVFMAFAYFGPAIPVQILMHPGVTWAQFINNIYFPAEGIYGVTLWVVSTVVFHFVLFGVVAQRMGLGQFFVDIAQVIAGRYTGGPAKVSVVSSAFFGTISGSSIANTVSTGSLTIPNMKRMGYPGHFAGGVEAASSAGGQITPPIMGAASFLMAEILEVPYSQIVIAAIIPAAMHYLGVLSIVHFEAKRLGLSGIPKDRLPQLRQVLKTGWPTVIPLIVLIYILFSGFTPYMAAFGGITSCIVIGFINPMHRMSVRDLLEAFEMGVKYALAVGAAAAAVGIVVGVITMTGVAFRLGFMVTNGALQMAESLYALVAWLPFELFSVQGASLFLSLVLVAIACILMGAGLPTTALYIMLSAVAQPALANLGIPALASHFFVLYYGVISEITPPVCASAYAAAGIAGANPFRTGISAFSLGAAKLMVPMVFVYSPAMLIILPEYFTWTAFLTTTLTCAIGVLMVAVGVTGYLVRPMNPVLRILALLAGVFMVAPGLHSDLWSLVLITPVILQQWLGGRRAAPTPS